MKEPVQRKKSEHRNFIRHQNNCPLCGNKLEIQINSSLQDFRIREEAHCTKCDLKARVKDHLIH